MLRFEQMKSYVIPYNSVKVAIPWLFHVVFFSVVSGQEGTHARGHLRSFSNRNPEAKQEEGFETGP